MQLRLSKTDVCIVNCDQKSGVETTLVNETM